jgi:predicted small secreted protein
MHLHYLKKYSLSFHFKNQFSMKKYFILICATLFFSASVLVSCSTEKGADAPDVNKPKAAFVITPTDSIFTGTDIQFSGRSLTAKAYFWRLGDDTYNSGQTITHSYSKSGTYKVILLAGSAPLSDLNKDGVLDINDALSTSDTISKLITVGFAKSEAAFAYTPDTAVFNSDVTFANNSKNASSYLWKFGDGETSTFKAPTHKYAKTGNYRVLLLTFNEDYADKNGDKIIDEKDGLLSMDSVSMPIKVDVSPIRKMLLSGYWYFESETKTIYQTVSGTVLKNETTYLLPCQMDDRLTFNPNGNIDIQYGAVNCADNNDTKQGLTWKLSDDGQTLTYIEGMHNFLYYKVTKVSDTKLSLYANQTESSSGVSTTQTSTLVIVKK